jgi:hypothetical protein
MWVCKSDQWAGAGAVEPQGTAAHCCAVDWLVLLCLYLRQPGKMHASVQVVWEVDV